MSALLARVEPRLVIVIKKKGNTAKGARLNRKVLFQRGKELNLLYEAHEENTRTKAKWRAAEAGDLKGFSVAVPQLLGPACKSNAMRTE
jgi:hypothetical protein